MMREQFIKRAIGVPFVDGGRTMAGWDCWGMVYVAYREVLGIELPTYGDISADDLRAVRRAMVSGAAIRETWRPVREPRPFDVVGMKSAGGSIMAHVGLYLPGEVLHVERASMTAREPIHGAIMRSRIIGYWRHADA